MATGAPAAPAPRHRFPAYGKWGLLALLLMQTAVYCHQTGVLPGFPWPVITTWTTPVNWWGYILLIDAWLYQRQGTSWLTHHRRLFALQCILSVGFWVVFEAYNRLIPGWRYINLDPNLTIRFVGYLVAFATIMPGMFLTTALIQSFGWFRRVRLPAVRWTPTRLNVLLGLGVAGCTVPAFLPADVRGYWWAAVWVGWFFMLEPINYRRGLPSILRDWETGDWSRTLQLFAAGAICGLLWEFWNAWAYSKWEYVFFPESLAHWKYFEMPILGFLGFLPFALDYFAMFHFLASFYTREDRLGL